ncbi:MAG: cation:proton antiporter [Candidatus Paceibacterota bacterium]|jgi:Kef-type K+ transport system membrane component KefB
MQQDIGILFVLAALFGLVFKIARQPMIPAYVLAGVVVGPLCLGWINQVESIGDMSGIAATIMLFVIGIEMDLSRLKKLGLVAIGGGCLQVIASFGLGFGLAKLLGMTSIAGAYIGFATSFSSTMLVVKVLGEKYDLNTLYGRISIGILVMQDVMAIFALSILTTANDFSVTELISTGTITAGLILLIVMVCGKFVFPRLFWCVARERETLFVVAMGVLFVCAFYAAKMKLSMGIGSFLAGLAMASLAYQHEIIGDFKALKSFFTVLFFAALGLQLAPTTSGASLGSFGLIIYNHLTLIVLMSVAVIVIKPLLVMIIVGLFGYERSSAFNSGLALGQLSEFSLVLVAQGVALKHLDPTILPPFIVVTVVSMTISSYLIKYNLDLYQKLRSQLWWLDKLTVWKQEPLAPDETMHPKIVLVGYDRLGKSIGLGLKGRETDYLVIDHDPDIFARLLKDRVPCRFGDACSEESRAGIDFSEVETMISTAPDIKDNGVLAAHLSRDNPTANFVAITSSNRTALALYERGVHFVLVTHMLAAETLGCYRGSDAQNVSLDVLLKPGEELRHRGKEHWDSLKELDRKGAA